MTTIIFEKIFEDTSREDIRHLIILCIIMYVFVFYIIPYVKILKPLQVGCIIPCNHNICKIHLPRLRDKNYYLQEVDRSCECIFTIWEFTHVIFHIYLGYFYNIKVSLLLSILFEIYEHYVYDCGSYLDILYNLMGYIIGYCLKTHGKNSYGLSFLKTSFARLIRTQPAHEYSY